MAVWFIGSLGFEFMNVLTINAGSTSVKFAVFASDQDEPLREGEISWASGRRDQARLTVVSRGGGRKQTMVSAENDQAAAACAIQAALGGDTEPPPMVDVVGHRIVHGGIELRESVVIDAKVRNIIADLGRLAPLHNPPALRAMEAAQSAFPNTPQVAVFDTAFFAQLPSEKFVYPLPYDYYEKYGIRRFGFHGISMAYCTSRADELLKRPAGARNLIICHLGGGCSASAIRDGRPVATTLGFSPLDGLMMGSRPGGLDPGILLTLQRQHGLTLEQIDHDLNYASGLLGISGISPDLANIEKAMGEGNERARLAFEMFADRVRSAIGGLAVTLGRLDGLVFTDRIGEHSPALRARVCEGLEILGLRLDPARNKMRELDVDIAATDSHGRILVIHTREELMIAREAARVMGGRT
jgi:acetate kinase